jgi:hypothetical protein
MSPASYDNLRGLPGKEQGRQDRTEKHGRSTGCGNLKTVLSAFEDTRQKNYAGGMLLCAFYLGIRNLAKGQNTSQVLRFQTRLFSVGPDVVNSDRSAKKRGKGQRSTQYLPSPFAKTTINMNRLSHIAVVSQPLNKIKECLYAAFLFNHPERIKYLPAVVAALERQKSLKQGFIFPGQKLYEYHQ